MATKLDKTIKRELDLDGTTYTIAIGPDGLKITQKGHRKGQEMSWRELVRPSGEEGGGGGASDAHASGTFDRVVPGGE
jgi:hypothetical protein